jgi:hypothetical protein
MEDIRLQQAREHHRAANAAEAEARRHRQVRDRLLRELHAGDPRRWTYRALAGSLGCSYQLIGHILGQQDAGTVGPGTGHPAPG